MLTGRNTTSICVSDYRLGGQLLIWAARHWVRSYRRGRMVPPCVWQSFAVAGLGQAYAELCRLMRIIAFRELAVSSVRTPGVSRLSEAERKFMSLFETAEQFGPVMTQSVAESFATPAVAREMVAAVGAIMADLARHGHRISVSGNEQAERPPATGVWERAANPH